AVVVANYTGYGGRILSEDGRPLHGGDQLVAWESGTTRLLHQLEADQVPVVLALDPPALGFDPIECIARHRSVAWCTPSRNEALRISRPFNDATRAGLRDADYGSVYDPTNVICDPRRCRLEIHDVLVYADADHITYEFSLGQAAEWRTLLTASMGTN